MNAKRSIVYFLTILMLSAWVSVGIAANTTTPGDLTTLLTQISADGKLPETVAERGADHRVWQQINLVTNISGRISANTNSYVEITTGLHHFENGAWVESRPVLTITTNGAVGTASQHKVAFAPNVNTVGAVDMLTPDGKRLRSRIAGISFSDTSSGKAVLIAAIKDSFGLLVGENEVIYTNAFDTVEADVQYIYSLAGLEQNVVWREQLPSPATLGMNPDATWLQVLTEFFDAPEPVKKLEPSGFAETLDFGKTIIGRGRAFAIGEEVKALESVAVGKQWVLIGGRKFLVESVPFNKVAKEIQALERKKDGAMILPNRRGQGLSMAAALESVLPKSSTGKNSGKMMVAKLDLKERPGFVLDYTALSSQANFTFAANTNYYVSGVVNLSGTTTIEGGTVVKFASGTTPVINITGSVDCRTSMYRPAIFTSKDDHTVGEAFGTGKPGTTKYGNGLTFSASGMTLNYLRFSYANSAITPLFSSGQLSMTNMQFMNCTYPVDFGSSIENTIIVDNSLFYAVTNLCKSGDDHILRGRHLTINQCTKLFDLYGSGSGEIYLTNSIIAAVSQLGNADIVSGSHNAFFNSPTFGYSPFSGGNPFLSPVGAASHYLADDTYRNKGSTEIANGLLAELKQRTTYPPTEITANIATDAVLTPIAPRDIDQPDLGYHYDPMDYVASGRTVSANLTLAGGVVLGTYGASSTFGLGLSSGSFLSEGTPTRLNWIVRYNAVQEQSTTAWSASTAGSSVRKIASSPTVTTRFTGWSLLGGSGEHFYDDTGNAALSSFSHSQFFGGKFDVYPGSVALTNCIWQRVYVYLRDMDGDPEWLLLNNLFYGGRLEYRATENPVLLAFDNLFDKTQIVRGSQSEYFTHGNNGYVGIAHLGGTSAGGDIDVTSAVYEDGPLGRYYYSTTSGNLSQLINADTTRTPADAGLYHYTVKKAQDTKEGTDSPAYLDIGFHYVAVDANGRPLDNESDGLADYFEDWNGDGSYTSTTDLSNWQNANTDADDLGDGAEWRLGRNPRNADTVSDSNGLVNLQVHTPLR